MKKAKRYLSAAGLAVLVLLGASRLSTSNSTPTLVTNVDAQVTNLQNFGAAASTFVAAAPTPTPTPAVGAGVAVNGDPGGFEIDGNLRASVSSVTDWLDTTAGSGFGGLFFENGTPKDPTATFRLNDPYATSDDVFPGGLKIKDNPSTYTWLTNSANNKTDMNNVFVHISKDSQVPPHTWITASGDRYVTNGTAYIDFELNQAAVTKVMDNTTCSVSQQPCGYFKTDPAGSPCTGPTPGPLCATGGRTPNDLLITAAYGQGGSLATIIISQWANVGTLQSPSYDWKDITSLVPNSSAFVATYIGTTSLPVPYGAFGGSGYVQNQFVEMSVDVTKLIGLAVDPCAGIIVRSVFVKTKTSTTPTATLMDFAAPVGITFSAGFVVSATPQNPSCSTDTASVTATFSGGTGTYQCKLDNGSFAACTSPQTYNGVAAGSHTVTVKDSSGCTKPSNAVTISIPSAVTASGTEKDPDCSTGSGTMTVTFSGGTPGYTCSLDGGAFAACTSPAIFNNLTNGSHTVTVKDSKGCAAPDVTNTVTIPSGVTASGAEKDPDCSTGSGTMTVTFSGGTPGYTCSLDAGAFAACTSPAIFNNLTNGSHTVTVKDSKGCAAADVTKTVTIPSAVTTSGTEKDPDCSTGSGSMTVTFSGGTPGYQCSLDGAAFAVCTSPATFNNLTNGSHTVTVKDSKACAAPDVTKTVTIPSGVTATGTEKDPDCSTGSGSMTVTFSGGTPGYTCSVDGGAFAACTSPAIFNNLTNGSHTVTVKDSKNCAAPDVTKTVTIPTGVTASGEEKDPDCSTGSGTMTVTFSGGTPGYTCSVDAGAFAACTSPAIFNNLTNGSHTVIVKDSKACAAPDVTKTVTIPTAVIASAAGTNPKCSTGLGTITASASGGTGSGYTFQLDNGAFQSSGTFNGVSGGTHTVTAKDSNGCTATSGPVTITIPDAVIASAAGTNPKCSTGLGTITASATGGTGSGYTFQLDNGAFQSSGTFNGVSGGTHTVTAKDSNGCTATSGPVTITIPDAVIASAAGTNPKCSTDLGTVTASASGGTGSGYTFQLDNGAFQSSGTFNGVSGGTHTVTAKDSNGCTATSGPVTITIPEAVVASAAGTNPKCSTDLGTITASATGGSGSGYTFQLDNGAFQSSGTFNGVSGGTHTVTAKDSNGCTATSGPVTITIPEAVIASAAGTNPKCSTELGTITASASGGSGSGYTFQLDNGAFQSSGTFNGVSGGTHTVTAKDSNGCTATSGPVTITIPEAVIASAAGTNPKCSTELGTITASASGGTGSGYTFQLDNGAFQSSGTFNGVSGGTHTVTAKDSNGCTATSGPVTITIPDAVIASAAGTNPKCSTELGTITASASGGTGSGYTFQLDNGAFQSSGTFNGVSGGTHTVTAKDSNGCTATSGPVTITIPEAVVASAAGTNPKCSTDLGTITASATGGTGSGYTFQLDNGAFQSSGTFNGVSGGTHTVTARDSNGCTATSGPVTITIPDAVVASAAGTNPKCGTELGTITASATGGTGSGYTFQLDNGAFQSSGTFNGVSSGTHTVTAKDSNGCTATSGPVTITIPEAVTASAAGTNPKCSTGLGTITASASGGSGSGYTFQLDNGAFQSSGTFNGVSGGTHTVTAKDSNGCTATSGPVTITIPEAVTASAAGTNPKCSTGLGTITASASGGSGSGYTFQLDNGAFQSSGTFNGVSGGTHTVTAKDSNGCTATSGPVTITIPDAVIASAAGANPMCSTGLGIITASATGGSGSGYTFQLDNGAFQSSGTFNGVSGGTHTVTAKDSNGCTATSGPVTITIPDAVIASAAGANPMCSTGLGIITASASGGSGSGYTFQLDNGAFQSSGTFNGVSGGTHTVTAKDSNGCTATSGPVTIIIPSAVTLTLQQVACSSGNNGSVSASFGGGTTPYMLQVDGGGFYSVTTSPQTLSGLTAGSHQVDFQDANGCSKSAQITVDSCPITCATTSSITSNFNGTSISPSNYIWFNANFNASGVTNGTTISFVNSSLDIVSASGTHYAQKIPDSLITFSNVTCATTTYNATLNRWETTVPVSGSDEILLSALLRKESDITGSSTVDLKASTVTWKGDFSTNTSGLTLSWKWGAAVYQNNSNVVAAAANMNLINVKPTHTNACGLNNGDHAGTPESKKIQQSVIGGARGGGGSNFTGSWSGTQNVTPCATAGASGASMLSAQTSSSTSAQMSAVSPASSVCSGTGSLRTLTMTYEGRNSGGGTVTGNPGGLDAAYIVVTGGSSSLFSGAVSFNSKTDPSSAYFVIDGGNAPLPQQATVTIYTARGGAKVSTVTFDTSCKQPLNVGDYFGSLRVSMGSQ